jgi:BolA protein
VAFQGKVMAEKNIYQTRMRDKLTAALDPIHLEIKDDSKKHAGHAGADPKGETHFSVSVVSPKFEGLNAVARHRLIYAVLAEELKERVHALSLESLTPDEYNRR